MIEAHSVEAKDMNGNWVAVKTCWLPDCADPQEDTYGGVAAEANQWGVLRR